jgi:hypothetical protein
MNWNWHHLTDILGALSKKLYIVVLAVFVLKLISEQLRWQIPRFFRKFIEYLGNVDSPQDEKKRLKR